MSVYNLGNGAVDSNTIFSTQALSATNATLSVDPTQGGLATLTPTQAMTLNATNVANGSELVLVVTTSGTTSYTLTFGTNFDANGTLATGTVSGKNFVLRFMGVNGTLVETGRTTAE